MKVLSILAFLSLFCGCGAGEQEVVGEKKQKISQRLDELAQANEKSDDSFYWQFDFLDIDTAKKLAMFKGKLYTNFNVK